MESRIGQSQVLAATTTSKGSHAEISHKAFEEIVYGGHSVVSVLRAETDQLLRGSENLWEAIGNHFKKRKLQIKAQNFVQKTQIIPLGTLMKSKAI
jgi:hypothetical protein